MDYFGINSQKLHELSGVSTSILSSVLNGRYGLSVTTAQKIAKALNIDINFLYTHPHKTSQPKSNPPQSDKIPVIGYAGMGETLYMLGPYDDPVFLTPPIPFPGDFEVVIMNGHYLEPSIVKDSVLLFHAKPTDLALEEIKPSHFYLCGLHDGRVMIKMLARNKKNGGIDLLYTGRPTLENQQLIWVKEVILTFRAN